MPLSDVQIRSLKPRDRVYKVSDAHSLYIEVHPTGARLWRFKYTMHGKQKRIALGAYGCTNGGVTIWMPIKSNTSAPMILAHRSLSEQKRA